MYTVEVKGLCKTYSQFKLDQVSFHVPKGSIVGMVGENGAGKSTTINLMLGTVRKSAGDIRIFGMDNIAHEQEIKRETGVVFDSCHFHEMLTAAQVGRMLARIYPTWDDGLYKSLLDRFSVPVDLRVKALSKGTKMKLSIAAAMAHRPRLLILDEATSALDPIVRDDLRDILLEYIEDGERAVLFSTHIVTDIEKIADYVVFIHQGRVVFQMEKDVLQDQYGILRIGREGFGALGADEYLAVRHQSRSVECLVADREAAKRKYRGAVVDPASLEEIMLFFVKGGQRDERAAV